MCVDTINTCLDCLQYIAPSHDQDDVRCSFSERTRPNKLSNLADEEATTCRGPPSAFVGYVRDWTDFLGTKTEFQQQDVIGHSPGYKKLGDLSRSAAMRQSRLLQS